MWAAPRQNQESPAQQLRGAACSRILQGTTPAGAETHQHPNGLGTDTFILGRSRLLRNGYCDDFGYADGCKRLGHNQKFHTREVERADTQKIKRTLRGRKNMLRRRWGESSKTTIEHWTEDLRRYAMVTYESERILEESKMQLGRLESASRASKLDG